jgi:hypothetical protein
MARILRGGKETARLSRKRNVYRHRTASARTLEKRTKEW